MRRIAGRLGSHVAALPATLNPILLAAIAGGSLTLLVAGSVAAQSSWRSVPGRAIAALPRALQGTQMLGRDFLSCSRGEYWLGINTLISNPDDDGKHTVPGRLIVDGTAFPTTAHDGPDGGKVMVPVSALAAFKAGNQLTVQFKGGSATFSAVFSVRGAGSAIDHVIALCMQGAPSAEPR